MYGETVIKNGEIQTLCRQCDEHCGLNVYVEDGRITKITGFEAHPQNHGWTCPKGRAAVELVYHPERLLKPLRKGVGGSFVEIPYTQAIKEIADKMLELREKYGARSVAVWTGEAIGFLQQEQYARRFIHAFGSPNYFSSGSVCYTAQYAAYCLVQGYHTYSPDFENANLTILWGTNPSVSQPPLMRSIERARKGGAKLIVVDPRLSTTARKADIFVQIRPGTDGALAWGLARYLIKTKNYDRTFVEKYSAGFDLFAEYADRFTPEFVEEQTGVQRETVIGIAKMLVENMPRIANYTAIALEHQTNGVNTIRTLACLAGLCGAVDIKGGEPWAKPMGTRTLTLYDELPLMNEKPVGAEKYPVLYQFDKQCHSMTGIDYMLGNGEYPLRGLIVTGANPVLTNPNARKVAKAFASLELLVCRELFLTETAKLAHYILPAASFLERSELYYHQAYQLVTLTTKVLDIPGIVDEYMFWHDLAHSLGFGETYFPWKNEEDVNRWILEPTGVTVEELRKHPEGYVYDSFEYKKYQHQPFPTPTGKFEFSSRYLKELGLSEIPEYVPPPYRDHPNMEYPFVLITGARKPQFLHSRYRNIKRFIQAVPEAEVEIHPTDARRLGIKNQERVRIISQIGAIVLAAKVVGEKEALPGVLQITHGWDKANVNILTNDHANDPISGFPNLKNVAVKIEKVD
ncbi:MAG: molybdopterin-dependent oxidoreductase [Deltaproteobacteria bacterium]|nr:molybdopterin-dependent oxidoreductase [Deltaproteobacteria bacterium]